MDESSPSARHHTYTSTNVHSDDPPRAEAHFRKAEHLPEGFCWLSILTGGHDVTYFIKPDAMRTLARQIIEEAEGVEQRMRAAGMDPDKPF